MPILQLRFLIAAHINEAQLTNEYYPIDITDYGISICLKDLQFSNALLPIITEDVGISIYCKFSQSLKA